MLSDFDVAPTRERLAGQKQARDPVAGVHMIDPLHQTRPGRQGLSGLPDQLFEGLIHAHHGALGVIRAVVDLQHVFHVVDELRRGLLGDAPHPPAVRLEGVLF